MSDELSAMVNSRRDCAIRITRNGGLVRTRKFHVVTRMGPPNDLGVFNPGVDAVQRALLERYFCCKVGDAFLPPLEPVRDAYEAISLRLFREIVCNEIGTDCTRVALLDVLHSYAGPKFRVYLRAYNSLLSMPLSRKDSELSPFPKFEKQDLGKAPRIIQPRTARYNLKLGRYLKFAEKRVYKGLNHAWGAHTEATVIKGFNVVDTANIMRAKWDRFKDPVAVSIDATKFDMHVSEMALRFEHSLYLQMYAHLPRKQVLALAKLLSWQRKQRGVAYCDDGSVVFNVRGTRASGDLNTSLGNCVLMCSLTWAYCYELGVDAELANNGDDCVLFMERSELDRFLQQLAPWFADKGFRMGVDGIAERFERVLFCQSQPVWDGCQWRMVRDPLACLKKDPMCLASVSTDKGFRKWRGAVAECGLSLVPGIPVMQAFYECMGRGSLKAGRKYMTHVFRNTGAMERSEGLVVDHREPTPDTRESFCAAFGVTPDIQVAYEQYYGNMIVDSLVDCQPVVTSNVEESIPLVALAPLIINNHE